MYELNDAKTIGPTQCFACGVDYLRGSSFEGRGRALPCDAKTRELRQVTPIKAGGVVVTASAIDRLLQFRLRTGSHAGMVHTAFDEWDSYSRELTDQVYLYFRGAKSNWWGPDSEYSPSRFTDEDAKAWRRANPIEGYSEDWVDGDWYQDDDGIIWEWGYDIDRNCHRFFRIDFDICGWPNGRKREKPKL